MRYHAGSILTNANRIDKYANPEYYAQRTLCFLVKISAKINSGAKMRLVERKTRYKFIALLLMFFFRFHFMSKCRLLRLWRGDKLRCDGLESHGDRVNVCK